MYEYIYRGPLTTVTLKSVGDVVLMPGCAVTLPEQSPYVRRLVLQRRLEPVRPVEPSPLAPALEASDGKSAAETTESSEGADPVAAMTERAAKAGLVAGVPYDVVPPVPDAGLPAQATPSPAEDPPVPNPSRSDTKRRGREEKRDA